MRNRLCAVAATLGLLVGGVRAQEPVGTDPFAAPFFQPLSGSEATFGPSGATLSNAVATNDPRSIALPPEATIACVCDPGFKTWVTAELLIGRTRGPSLAPVVTTGPSQNGLLAGAIGQPTTLPLFGGKRVLDDWRSGVRVELGVWLDDEYVLGVGARFYSLFSTSEQFRAIPNGASVINVPQVVSAGPLAVQVPVFVGFPGVTTGRVGASAQTTFAGGDLNGRLALKDERVRVELLAGYRQLHLADELGANFTVAPVGIYPLFAPQLTGGDSVRTRNNFYGPQLGLYASSGGDRFWVEGHAAGSLGVTASTLDFARSRSGESGGTAGNPAALLAALGLPATPANIASAAATSQIPPVQSNAVSRLSYFGVVGEGGVRLNGRATEHVRVTAGYSFLYWNNVRRAQEMFVLAPVLRPQAIDFTTHLFSVGLELRF